MSFNGMQQYVSMFLLFISCAVLLTGFTLRQSSCGPWIMLLGICCALLIIAYNILYHIGVFGFAGL